jgi:hypothetical protein
MSENPVLKPKVSVEERLAIPNEYRSTKNGIIVTVDNKFVSIRLNNEIAQHIGAFRYGKFVEIKFLKEGGAAPIITSFNKNIDEA